jgi:hypothetical protein
MNRFLVVAAFCALGSTSASAQAGSTCRAADPDGLRFRSFIRQVVTSSDSLMIQARTTLGLRAMDSTRVVFVTDNVVCNKVAQGINTAQATPNLTRQLFVVSAGTVYAAQDPSHPSGEWWPTVTLDNKYKVLAVLLAP